MLQNANEATYLTELRSISANLITLESDRLNEMRTDPYYVSNAEILRFIQMTKKYVFLMGDMDNVVEELLTLINGLLDTSEVPEHRPKRDVKLVVKQSDLIEEYLSLSESQMNRVNQSMALKAKRKFIATMPLMMHKLCQAIPLSKSKTLS